MHTLKIILAIPLALAFIGCQTNQSHVPDYQLTNTHTDSNPQAILWVKGLTCPFCTYNVERQLRKLSGVVDVEVILATGQVLVTLDNDLPPTQQKLHDAITGGGFTVDRIQMP